MGKFRRSFLPVSATSVLALIAPSVFAGEARTPGGPRVPILFAPNHGQFAPEVQFQARTPGLVASVLADGLHLDLDGVELGLRFVGADGSARAEGCEPQAARAHYLSGASAARTVPTYARVRLAGVVPGVDLELFERDGRLEYDLWLAPGASAEDMVLAVDGARACGIDAEGALWAAMKGRTLRQLAPVAWQATADGGCEPVACGWQDLGGGCFGFVLGPREPDAALVIDPVLVYGSHVGGSNADGASAILVDEDGAAYVTGWARSVDFPRLGTPVGALRGKDAVVFKLAPDGRELVWATYLGGRGDDEGTAIALVTTSGEERGQVLVAGNTSSHDFPTTANALDRSASGGADGFVARLAADGSAIVFATLLGGSAEDTVTGLALTSSGQITLAGTTRSRDFPVSSASYAVEPRGARDAFLTRLDPRGERLVFSTRLGGSEDDEARGLAVDAEGCSYLTGRTESHDFPTTLGALDRDRCGTDAFVAKLSAGGRTLLYSTFLGGSGQDEGTAIAVDAERRAVVVGATQSLDFPFDAEVPPPGRKDGFAVRLSPSGNALQHATPLGGGSADEALGVALDALGTAWIVGRTRSADLPVSPDACRARLAGAADAFLVRLSDRGERLYATFLGGEGEDELCGVHADRSDTAVVVCGSSSGISLEQRGALAGKRRGPSDAFVLLFDPRTSPPSAPAPGVKAGVGLGF